MEKIVKKQCKSGVSLITLIVTIIIIIVLAGVIILSLGENNPIGQARLAVNLTEVRTVQESLDLYIVSNLDISGKLISYPTAENVKSSEIDNIMKERVAMKQGVAITENIDYSTLFYLDREKLGITKVKEKVYFIDTKDGTVYINNGIELENGVAYILTEAMQISETPSKLSGEVFASGNNTYVLKENGDMYSVGETGLYNPMFLSENNVYDVNTQPQKVDIGYEPGDRIYKMSTTTIIFKNNGDIYGLGGNTRGELGLGDTYPRYSLTKLPLNNVKEIYPTTSGSIFVLLNDGTLLGAGNNETKVIKNTDELYINKFTNITYNLDGGSNNKISNIVNVGANYALMYVELANGEVWAWGKNEFGVLDVSLGEDATSIPIRKQEIEDLKAATSSGIKKMESGNAQANFVLLENGDLYSKGYGGYDGKPSGSPTTVYGKVFSNVKDVYSTGTTSFLLDNNGDVYAWGNNATYSMGLEESRSYDLPTKLNIVNIVQLERLYALSGDGKLYRIGKTGDVLNKQIEDIPIMKELYSAGISIDETNNVWLSGDNSYAQLLVADKGSKNILTKSSIVNVQNTKSSISTHVILKKSAEIYATGANQHNQISPLSVTFIIPPTKVDFGGTIIDYAVSERNLYVIDSNNDLWGVGNNSYRQMGNIGATTVLTKYTAQALKFSKVFASGRKVLALTTDGKLFACGQDDYGEIGLGSGTGVFGSSRVAEFTEVTLDSDLNNIDFTKLEKIEFADTSSILLMSDGTVYGVGLNKYGELGLGDSNFRGRWTKNTFFNNKPKVIDIKSGSKFTLYLLENGDVYATGDNSFGQLGNGTKNSTNTPKKVNISDVKSISAGSGHVIVVRNDDTAWSFGKGSHGQLGNGKIASDVVIPSRAYELEK